MSNEQSHLCKNLYQSNENQHGELYNHQGIYSNYVYQINNMNRLLHIGKIKTLFYQNDFIHFCKCFLYQDIWFYSDKEQNKHAVKHTLYVPIIPLQS